MPTNPAPKSWIDQYSYLKSAGGTIAGNLTVGGNLTVAGTTALDGSTATTPATGDNSTHIATTAFVKAQGYLTGNQTITLSGDISGSGATAITTVLPNVNGNVGTFQGLTVNAKGQVMAATNMGYAAGGPFMPLSGGTLTGTLNVNPTGGVTPSFASTVPAGNDADLSLQSGTQRWSINAQGAVSPGQLWVLDNTNSRLAMSFAPGTTTTAGAAIGAVATSTYALDVQANKPGDLARQRIFNTATAASSTAQFEIATNTLNSYVTMLVTPAGQFSVSTGSGLSGGIALTSAGGTTVNSNLTVTGATQSNGALASSASVTGKDVWCTPRDGPYSGAIYITGGAMRLYSNNGGDWLWFDGGNVWMNHHHPVTPTNTYQCGTSGFAWQTVCTYNVYNPSDRRQKAGIEALPDCLDLVQAIDPRRYKFTNGPEEYKDQVQWGFIADEIGDVMARAGYEGNAFAGFLESEGMQMLNYANLTAVLWKAVQELAARIERLEGRA